MFCAFFGVMNLAGCAGESPMKKDPFFEKWQTMEQTSKGHSPVAKSRTLDVQDIISKSGSARNEEKPVAAVRRLPTKEVSLKMRQADVKAVLRALALASGLNILIKNDVKGEVSVDFKAVPWNQAFTSILRNQGLTYEPNPWDGGIIRVMSMEDQERDLKRKANEVSARSMEQLTTIVIPIEYGKPKDIADNLKDFLTKDKDGKQIGSIKVDEHSNSLIVSALRQDLDQMMSIIEKIDKPTHQILIKANIVEATKDTARNLGVQWGGAYKGVYEGKNVYVTPGGTTAVGSAPTDPTGGTYTPTAGSPGLTGQGFGVNFPAAGLTAAGAGSLGLIFGTIGGNVLELQLSALQQDNKINILSSPSITTLDNQMAYTENGERVPYVSTSSSTSGTTQDVKFEDAVLRLEIKPHVIGEKNLKMEIMVKKNEVDNTRNVLGNPYIIKKETKTTLIVKDGETIVISGLTKQQTTGTESGIPWLKNIYGLGWLFKSSGTGESMEEVLIFITPTILPPQGIAAAPPATDNPVEKAPSEKAPVKQN